MSIIDTYDGDPEEVLIDGVRFFHSRFEMRKNIPFKLYQITQEFGSLCDHTHDYVQIWYIKKGMILHTINQKKYKMVPGNLYVIPPYVVHSVNMDANQETEILGCEFLPSFIQGGQSNDSFEYLFLDEERTHAKVAFTGQADLEVKLLLENMLEEYTTQKPNYELMIRGSLLMLLAHTIREWHQAPLSALDGKMRKHKEIMEDIIEFIHKNYMEDIRLEDVVRQALMSRTYFCDLFKQYTNKTFNEYLIELRLRKSMDLLLRTDLSVTDISLQIGFNHLTHFSRVFKKHTGVTPLNYRKHAQMLAEKSMK